MIGMASRMQYVWHPLPTRDVMTRARRRRRPATNVKFVVNLTGGERAQLQQLLRAGRPSARRVTRARILLKADEGLSDAAVAAAVDVGIATVHRIRQRCVEEGLDAALEDRARRGAPRCSPARRRRISWRRPVASRLTIASGGPYGSWPIASSSSSWPSTARMRPCGAC